MANIFDMDETVNSEVIDLDKSSYRMELVRSSNGTYYISVEQTVFSSVKETKSQIRIKGAAIQGIIDALEKFQSLIPKIPPEKGLLTPARKAELLHRYLNKGLEIKNLAIQFGCTVGQVEQLLFDENIVVTSNKISEFKRRRQSWKQKKRDSK